MLLIDILLFAQLCKYNILLIQIDTRFDIRTLYHNFCKYITIILLIITEMGSYQKNFLIRDLFVSKFLVV